MRKILILALFAGFCSAGIILHDCDNDCYKEGFKPKPRPALTKKDIAMFNSVYNQLLNEDCCK